MRAIIVIVISILSFSLVLAAGTQDIRVSIGEDLLANINHSLPVDTNEYSGVQAAIITDLGDSLADYKFKGAHDSYGDVNYTINNNIVDLDFNKPGNGIQDMVLEYEASSAFDNSYFVSYDFTFYTDKLFMKSPNLEIFYPSSLNLISTNPPHSNDHPIKIDYPDNKNSGLASIYFLKNNLSEEYVKIEQGDFIIIGRKDLVNKIQLAVENLTFLKGSFQDLTGKYSLEKIYIIITDLSGSKSNFDVGGEAHTPKIILIDEQWLETEGTSQLTIQSTIVHEATHLENSLRFKTEEKNITWLDEGLATFFEIYILEKYLNISDYWIDDDEKNIYFNENLKLLTKKELLDQYKKDFYFDIYAGNNETISILYAHAGLVFNNFYLETGQEGLRKLYSRLETLESSGRNCSLCDTNNVLKIMEEISSKTREDILFPYKNAEEFDVKIDPLIRQEYTEEERQELMEGFSNQGKKYSSGNLFTIFIWATIIVIAIFLTLYFIRKFSKK